MKRKLIVAGVAAVLLAVPLVGTADADANYWNDQVGDCCPDPPLDIVQYSVALNQDVLSTTVYTRTYDRAVIQGSDLYADVDINGDGATDFELYKQAGGETAVLRNGEFGPTVAGCPVAVRIDSFTTYQGGITMSTTAACVNRPTAVRIKYYLTGDSTGFDVAPGFDTFSPAVSRGVVVRGAIYDKWVGTGGINGFLGRALTDENATARGGAYNLFSAGAIYWTNATGAHWVRGAIRDRWGSVGAEWGVLGYPKTDEIWTGGRPGAVTLFEGGSVYWSAATGAHAMYGGILQAWGSQGYEGGRLGFPSGDEFSFNGGRKQEFQGGNIVWTAGGGAVIAYR